MKITYTSGKQLDYYLPYQKSKLDEIQVLLIELWSPLAQTEFTTLIRSVEEVLQAQGDWQNRISGHAVTVPFL